MTKQTLYKLAALTEAKDNDWYVSYSVWHPVEDRFVQIKVRKGLSESINSKRLKSNIKERRAFGNDLAKIINHGLKSGKIDPFRELRPDHEQKETYTVLQAFEWVVEQKQAQFSKENKGHFNQTFVHYKSAVTRFLQWAEEKKYSYADINQINQQRIYEFMDWNERKYKLQDTTWNNYLRRLSVLFSTMAERGIIDFNPCAWDSEGKRPKRIKKRAEGYGRSNEPFTDQEKKILKEKLRPTFFRLYVAFLFGYYCGRRPREVVQLKVSDIAKDYSYFTVSARISKNNRAKAVPIPLPFKEELLLLELHKYPDHYFIFGQPNLQTSEEGIHFNTIFKHWAAKVKAPKDKGGLGIDKGIYRGKHTGAKDKLESGDIDLRDLKELFDHMDYSTTERYAASITNTRLEKIRNKTPEF